MHTELFIAAVPGKLPEIRGTGAVTARRTGTDAVHLIGTAATPLGGDRLDITITLAAGARLTVRSVAATLALPGSKAMLSQAYWNFDIADDAVLDFAPEPTVVAAAAEHRTITKVQLGIGARLRLRERVQLGRAGEDDGRWRGELIADVGETPLLRHRLDLGSGTAGHDGIDAPRAVISELCYPDPRSAETHGLSAALLPLAAGGTLYTRTGTRL